MPNTTHYLRVSSREKHERGVGNGGEMKKRGPARMIRRACHQLTQLPFRADFLPGTFLSEAYLLEGQEGSQGQRSLSLPNSTENPGYPECRSAHCRARRSLPRPGTLGGSPG